MATNRQIAANRRNGLLGRGPKTSAGKARSSRNALKHGLSIPVNRDKTLRRQIEVLARILVQSQAGNVFWQARAAAEAELELVRARVELEAVLTRAGITAEWNGGPEQSTALIHVLPELQRLERYERRAFSKRRRSATGSLNEARAAAEAELEFLRARAVLDGFRRGQALLPSGTVDRNKGTALTHVLPELQRLKHYERRAFSKPRRIIEDL
jgi:hypothetical protein